MFTRTNKSLDNQVDSVMRDTRFDWLRTRRSRIALVALMVVILIVNAAVWVMLPQAGIFWVLIGIVVGWALRMSVRAMADLPEEYLDERQNQVRDRAYADAYRWFVEATLVAAVITLLLYLLLSTDDQWTVTFTFGGLMAAFWTFAGLALTLPSMVLALRERGE
jgi:MFS family permease